MSSSSPDPFPTKARGGAQPRPRNPGDLFWSFTWLALQGFGGVLAVVQRELVEKKRWLTNEEFVEDWAVAQIDPASRRFVRGEWLSRAFRASGRACPGRPGD